jgi:hypothetical protein
MITQPKNRLRLAAAMGILLATGYSGAQGLLLSPTLLPLRSMVGR